MDTLNNINTTNEAEKLSQPEVVDLSTTVEPMDADDGLDLDPYSPVGSTNTEEMEELLNSPPKGGTNTEKMLKALETAWAVLRVDPQILRLRATCRSVEVLNPGLVQSPASVPNLKAASADQQAEQPDLKTGCEDRTKGASFL
ncbi:hypothetical protein ACLKA7_000900 [Drosophila subpalustris]